MTFRLWELLTQPLSCKHHWRLLVVVAFSVCTFISLIPLFFFQYCINVFGKTAWNSIKAMLCPPHQIQSAAALGASSWFRCATLLSAAVLGRGFLGWGTGWCTFYMLLKLESVPERLGRVPCETKLGVTGFCRFMICSPEISSLPIFYVRVQCSLPRFF